MYLSILRPVLVLISTAESSFTWELSQEDEEEDNISWASEEGNAIFSSSVSSLNEGREILEMVETAPARYLSKMR
ncbi:hypothetical protein Pmani_037647 [Petrolisthes manimaculis]|uniref:Uncharacterized protein n=1 Tax=Petrolisthes manimaculis TaxID=1843537 RepID=A0AAE1NFW0_9EUCA|nr:hypothetical protein Pmani_037647 [Petrolisthes manimaculis]